MWARNAATQNLGINLLQVGQNSARLALVVTEPHRNSCQICHGGVIFTLADSAFAGAQTR